LLVNGTLQERRVFRVNRISDVIKDRVYSLFKNLVFIPSSTITGLNDSVIIVRLGGDKGGKTMAFKFGVTVMNCLQPNLPESFDLLGTVEAFDTYLNLKTALFDHFKSELHHLCQIDEGREPSLIVIFQKISDIKVLILIEIHSGVICDPILHEAIVVDSYLIEKIFSPLIKAAIMWITVPIVI
jgi:hypothetical protein